MKSRKWEITYNTVESGLGSPGCTGTVGHHVHHGYVEMAPTVVNIRKYIAEHFPEEKIDERWESVKEMIAGELKFGFFSIDLRPHNSNESDYLSRSIGFMEV